MQSDPFAEFANVIFLTHLFEEQAKPCPLSVFFERIKAKYGEALCPENTRIRTETLIKNRKVILEKLQPAALWNKDTDPFVLVVLRNAIAGIIEKPSDFDGILRKVHIMCDRFNLCHPFIHSVLVNYSKINGIAFKRKSFDVAPAHAPETITKVKLSHGEHRDIEINDDTPVDTEECALGYNKEESSSKRTRLWTETALLLLGANDASQLPASLTALNKQNEYQLTMDSVAYRQALGFFENKAGVSAVFKRLYKPKKTITRKVYKRLSIVIKMGIYAQMKHRGSLNCREFTAIVQELCGSYLMALAFAIVKTYENECNA
jgi:hypothetical protein